MYKPVGLFAPMGLMVFGIYFKKYNLIAKWGKKKDAIEFLNSLR